jgi:hypothetical protein
MYLVNDSGLLVGRYTEVRELEGRLHEVTARAAQASR